MSTGIAHVAFMDLRLSSFSSHCHLVLIAYSSLSFHISLLTAYDDDSLLLAHSFPYLKVVRPLLILDMIFRVTFGDVLEEA
ncbi:hypothetical protein CK203_083735 [Vitis vinifera]|uniref:Uncharacterized protein n=1 Tax=Vitis vinifera TaxID=29760 RepID=A0A438F0C3_VITVI|nr:hypothetical protein CK203_083735 [Vitis vinifera]